MRGLNLHKVPIHVETQKFQALPGIERSTQEMQRDDSA